MLGPPKGLGSAGGSRRKRAATGDGEMPRKHPNETDTIDEAAMRRLLAGPRSFSMHRDDALRSGAFRAREDERHARDVEAALREVDADARASPACDAEGRSNFVA